MWPTVISNAAGELAHDGIDVHLIEFVEFRLDENFLE